ncbi:MAG TPA: hypothetical protein PKA63_03770 [Oligoflexia bacterium]|nr:hypothetical protein [Oligoflexia bacterium]HMP47770.1 hypothetical protein [Oligoflexia bacterium]
MISKSNGSSGSAWSYLIWLMPFVAVILAYNYFDFLRKSEWVHKKGDMDFMLMTLIIAVIFILPIAKLIFVKSIEHNISPPIVTFLGLGLLFFWKLTQHWMIFLSGVDRNEVSDPAFGFSILTAFTVLVPMFMLSPVILLEFLRRKYIKEKLIN